MQCTAYNNKARVKNVHLIKKSAEYVMVVFGSNSSCSSF